MKYRREIDGLRSLAVLPVILFHAGSAWFQGGFVGVDVFFVISGYLITSIVLAESAQGRFSTVAFYERRFRRILPALFFVMFCTALLVPFWLMPSENKAFAQSVSAVTLFGSNFLFWWTSGYFEAAAELKPLLHTWSLGVEEQYYLLLPLLIVWLGRSCRPKMIFAVLAVISVVSLAASEWAVRHAPTAAFYLLPFRAWELLAGSLVACRMESVAYRQPSIRLAQWGSAVGVLMLAYAVFAYDETMPFPGLSALLPVLATVCVIVFADERTMAGRLLSTRPLVQIGLISYSAYLWHNPLFALARIRSELPLESGGVMYALSLLSLVLAYFTWKYIEAPFRNREKFTRRQIFGLSVIGSTIFCVAGVAGHFYFHAKEVKYDYGWDTYTRKNHCLIQDFDKNTHDAACVAAKHSVDDKKVLLWGDSHAASLYQGLAGLAAERHWALSQLTQSACPPLLDTNNGMRTNCSLINLRILQDLPKQQYDVIVLHSIWAFKAAPLPLPEISRRLSHTLSQIKAMSPRSRIIVVGNVPRWYISAQRALHHYKVDGSVPLYRKSLIMHDLEQVLAQTAQQNSVVFFRPSAYLCKQPVKEEYGECLLSTDGSEANMLYTDGDHLSKTGADILVNKMSGEWLQAVEGQP